MWEQHLASCLNSTSNTNLLQELLFSESGSLTPHTSRPTTKCVLHVHTKHLVTYTKHIPIVTARHIYCFCIKTTRSSVCEYKHSANIAMIKMGLENKSFENWAKIEFKKQHIAGVSLVPHGLPQLWGKQLRGYWTYCLSRSLPDSPQNNQYVLWNAEWFIKLSTPPGDQDWEKKL